MPYILPKQRIKFDEQINRLTREILRPGELNYVISRLMRGEAGKIPGYAGMSRVVGEVESAKLEFYRTEMAPYEDLKRDQNGDV